MNIFDSLDKGMQPVLYFPYEQGPDNVFNVMVRTAGEPSSVLPSFRAEVGRVDPSVTVSSLTTIEQVMTGSVAVFQRRSVLALIGAFAVASVLLAAIGLYGVLTQVVVQRSREIGVRVALGASGSRILAAVLRPGLLAVAIGIVAGIGGALLVGRALSSLLFETSPLDALTLTLVVAVLVMAAGLAAVIPGRRALRVNPVDALRSE